MSVFRLYVEKKPGYDIESGALLHEFQNIFGIKSLTGLRLINRYDVEGLDGAYLDAALNTVFSEPQTDNTFEALPDWADFVFGVELLPGQFDQRADVCAQCLQMLSGGKRPLVRTARIYLLKGKLTDADIAVIKRHLINPVESMEAALELPSTLEVQYPTPPPIPVLHEFLTLSDADIPEFCARYGLAMDPQDLAFCQEYFRDEGRAPTLTELRVIDTYWSDHCRHTTFLTHLKDISIDDEFVRQAFDKYLQHRKTLGREDRPTTLMDLATIGARLLEHNGQLTSLDKSEEVNACSVKIKVDEDGSERDWLLMFKNETHNHPTEIEPFGGAATCVGGAIRDVLAGRSYVYQAMRVTGAGDPTVPVSETLHGKLPQRSITTRAAKGNSSYGNQIGLAAGLIKEIYHPGYIAKRMEAGAIIGAAPERNVVRQNPEPGDKVILLGGRTGRDGCGGATGSSKTQNVDSLAECGAEVQKGNAPEERKIQRLFRNPEVARLIKRCNDFGAGGVSVAVGELADGLNIDLDAVPKKYNGLDGTELAISESQERMAVVVSADDVDAFTSFAADENLEATVIAEVTGGDDALCDQPRLIMNWNGQRIVDISRKFLSTNGTTKYASATVKELPSIRFLGQGQGQGRCQGQGQATSAREFFASLVSNLNVCSQKGLIEGFDSTIGAGTVLYPLGGKYQMTPVQAMAAKIPVLNARTSTCSLMSYAFYPYVSQENPYAAAYLAVAASIAKIIAAGGSSSRCWLSFQEFFERLGDTPERWGKPFSALLGALEAQIDLGIASIGGKDSMSGSYEKLDVPPTLVSFAVGAAKVDNVVSGEFKRVGSNVALLSPQYREDGSPIGESLKSVYAEVERLILEKKALAAYVVEDGSVGEAVFKMAIGNRIGFGFDKSFADLSILSGHYIGSIILEIDSADVAGVLSGEAVQNPRHCEGACDRSNPEDPRKNAISGLLRHARNDGGRDCRTVSGVLLGQTTAEFSIKIGGEVVDCLELLEKYEKRLESVFPHNIPAPPTPQEPVPIFNYARADFSTNADAPAATAPTPAATAVIKAKPRVLIPVFPGTNCEYDMAKAFTLGGAETEMLVIKNLSPNDIKWSVAALTDAINRSQIVALPGGFSGSDEPEGSAKFIVSLLKNPRIKDAIHNLLGQRDGLMCGICNGFQALIKLGLVPYGEIIETDENSPTLTFNTIGRHQSMIVQTRVASNKSPWLSGAKPDDIHTVAISHGEGRFVAAQSLIEKLAENGQIATQYVDFEGNPSMDVRFNPNGSICAIEGITSPDGRVFGKMGHNERSGSDLYINVPKAPTTRPTTSDIFAAAVRYFY